MSSPETLTIYLSNRAPKTLDVTEWPVLVASPEANKAQDLMVRVKKNPTTPGVHVAVVYGQTGAGIADLPGAGMFAGQVVSRSGTEGEFLDEIAHAIFKVGAELGMDLKKHIWPLVRKLNAHPL